ncbi:MAG TPA: hypothetical protein VLJ61_14985 [Pyrinomonadaceae bacterium]|nr:hypothetical protein [Pyrinomonadaceae bacterium]
MRIFAVIRFLLTITLLCCFNANAAIVTPHPELRRDEPRFSVGLDFSSEGRFPLAYIELSVVAPDGRVSWTYKAEGKEQTDALIKQEALTPEGWYDMSGKYTLTVSYRIEGEAESLRAESQEFAADGQELRVGTRLWFISDKETHKSFLASMTLTRYLSTSSSVWLVGKWNPSREGRPRYEIVNSLTQPIYGVGWEGNFFGHVEAEAKGHWRGYPRGGFCGTVSAGKPIQPGGKDDSIEGYFMGEVSPFAKGRYRYVVSYSLEPSSFGVPTSFTDAGRTFKRMTDVYEVTEEFRVDSDAKQPQS